jgi:hypothetical protein
MVLLNTEGLCGVGLGLMHDPSPECVGSDHV